MSIARPARGALTRCLTATRAAQGAPCHQFHSSVSRSKRRPRFRNVSAEQMGLLKPEKMAEYQREHFPKYTPQEEALLRKKYTPEQMQAITEGEAAIDLNDMVLQGRLRTDKLNTNYVDDFATLDPRFDVQPEVEGQPREVKWKDQHDWADEFGIQFIKTVNDKTDRQLTRAMVRALRKAKQSDLQNMIDLTEEELNELEDRPELLEKYLVKEGKNEGTDSGPNAEVSQDHFNKIDEMVNEAWEKELEHISKLDATDAELELTYPELIAGGPMDQHFSESVIRRDLGKVPGVEGLFNTSSALGDDVPEEVIQQQHLTGLTPSEQSTIICKTVVQRFVDNQTRLGKIRSASVMAIAGNGNGRLGLGMAKSTSPEIAIATARMLAVRNMKPIRRYENRTIYGKVKSKISGTVVELAARPPGFGLRVPHRIFEMCRACGLHDLAAKMPRSKNPMNSVKATYMALTNQPDPEAMAIGRGKKLVDVRKVYYGGAVY